MKQSKIVIRDAKRKNGQKGFRVESRAKNGELLQISEVLNTPANVQKHIDAMSECWLSAEVIIGKGLIESSPHDRFVLDTTKDQIFVKKGWAKTGLKKTIKTT